ncbi:MAG: S24/S26 family peptidase [Clostridia bacterium]|nr:S24/S26 family peptidase [Clostridia bacterium]
MEAELRTISAGEAEDSLVSLINAGDTVPLKVTGSSMVPFLRNGRDTVWLCRADRPKKGQILFFRRSDGTFILHRIRRIGSDGIMTVNGDAQKWCETVDPENAVAVAVRITRQNGKTVDTNGFGFRFLSLLWYPTRPVRPFLFKVGAALRGKRK